MPALPIESAGILLVGIVPVSYTHLRFLNIPFDTVKFRVRHSHLLLSKLFFPWIAAPLSLIHIFASGKEPQFSILKDLMHRSYVTEITNACDSGRDGELIFRFVYEQGNCKKPFSRLWICSMEASAIREGFSNLKDGRGYDNLYQSALCRAKADWLTINS